MTVDVMALAPISAVARMFAISTSATVSDPDVHDPTAIVDGKVVGQYLRHRVPVAGREVSHEAVVYLACGVLQPWRRAAEFVEPRERGVEVCLVEHLAAIDQVAFDRRDVDHPPLGLEALLRGPVRHVGDDRSEVAQPMHSLDVDAEVRREVPAWRGCMRSGHRARMLTARRWSMFTQSGVVAGSSCRLSCGVCPRDDRPRVCVGGRFAGEVSGVELLEGGVDVVGVERDERRDPLVGVDLDDAEHLGVERLGPLVAAREAGTTEGEALPAGRNDGRRHVRDPDVGDRPHVRDFGIPTASDPGVHDSTAIVDGNVVGQYLRHRGPVAGREVRLEALVTWLAAFSSRGAGRLSSSNLASAASRSASSNSSQRLIRSPSTVRRSISRHSASKPSCEVPCAALGDDRSEVAQPMHGLDVDADVRPWSQRGTEVCGQVTGREAVAAPMVDVHPVRCRRGNLVPVERGVGPRDDRPCVRVGGRFAGEVSGVEFLEGGVDVVEVERDACRDPIVGVDLDDGEHLGAERLGPLVAAREAVTS